MTDLEKSQAIQAASDPALLSGRRARLAMYLLACLASICPLLYYIPVFHDWRMVVGFLAALCGTIIGPTITLLVPKPEQEIFRQALIDSDAQNERLHRQMQQMRETFARKDPQP